MLELEEKDRIYWDEMYSHSLFKMDSEELLSRKFMEEFSISSIHIIQYIKDNKRPKFLS